MNDYPRRVRAWHWRLAVTNSDLPGTVRGVAQALACFMDQHGFSYAGIRTIAQAAGYTKQTVQDAVELLERRSWLEVERRGNGRSNHYHALVPSPDVEPKETKPSYLTRTLASSGKHSDRPTSQERPSYLTEKPSYLTRTDLEDLDISGADSETDEKRSREYARLKSLGLSPVEIAKEWRREVEDAS